MSKRDHSAPTSRTKHYEKVLHAKAEEVRRSVTAQRARQSVARLDVPSDEGDLSHQSHEEWLFLNRNNLEIKLLREVQQALSRIGDASFGICQSCEEPISTRRLDAIPWAKYCVACQERISAGGEIEAEGVVRESE